MVFSCILSSQGQVTIPPEIRVRLGLREGDRVEFAVQDGRTILRPARRSDNPFEAYVGALGTFPGGVKQINAWLNELRGEAKAAGIALDMKAISSTEAGPRWKRSMNLARCNRLGQLA